MTHHLIVSISGHGFGHVAQTAPILNLLHERMPKLRITVRSTVPISHLRSRIHAPFTHLPSEGDIGMVMSSALDVCVEESRAAYQKFHTDWDARVNAEAQLLRELKADFVFSNVGYLSLAGAQRAGIANAALCSLNWSDIYRHYCLGEIKKSVDAEPAVGSSPGGTAPTGVPSAGTVAARTSLPSTSSGRTVDKEIAAQIHACYANANAFLRATPGMTMNDLANLIPIAPIAAIGMSRREELNHRLNLSQDEKLVLVSMGGIAMRLPIERWPRISGVRWLVQQNWQIQHPDAIVLETLQMSFNDLLASCDALLCKPGYGSFVEAACGGVPVLYVNRPDWPEAPALVKWLQQHGVCREVSRDALPQGDIAEALGEIWDLPPVGPVIPEGADQVANWLLSKFD